MGTVVKGHGQSPPGCGHNIDHLIDVTLEAGGDVDHAARRIADDYPTDNVQEYMNIERSELDNMNLTKSLSNDPVNISNPLKKRILSLKGFWKCWGDIQ